MDRRALRHIYTTINDVSRPEKQMALLKKEPEYCKAVWARGEWEPTPPYYELMRDLRNDLSSRGLVYSIHGISAALHWTLMETHPFPTDPTQPIDATESSVIRDIVNSYPVPRIEFKGISRTSDGLFLCGYPSCNINAMRDEIRAALPDIVEPHPQNTCYATLFRFTETPTEEDYAELDSIVAFYEDMSMLKFTPTLYEYGYGTWRQTDGERKPVYQWTPLPRWILRRGLRYGPDADLENKESELWARIKEGWDIQIDVWCIAGVWWLGNDAPTYKLMDTRLLALNSVWIHCKNMDALMECRNQNWSGAHYFTHHNDPATLTSSNWIWCYPGTMAGKRSVCVLPESQDLLLDMFGHVGAVCSEYLPKKFYTKPFGEKTD